MTRPLRNTTGSRRINECAPAHGVVVGQQAAAGASAANNSKLAVDPGSPFTGSAATSNGCPPDTARAGGLNGNLPTASPFADPAKPWGRQQICDACNRGAHTSCICGPWPEDEDIPHVDYVDRVMGMLAPGWNRVEL